MKILILFISFLISFNTVKSQETKQFQFLIDSLSLDSVLYYPNSINSNIQVGKPKFFTILDIDSLKIRVRVKFTKRGSQPKKMKIRVDLFESGKWHKPPIFIDLHNFTRFRIRREQCWGRTVFSYNANFPFDINCSCWKPLKGKKSHEFNLWSTAIIN